MAPAPSMDVDGEGAGGGARNQSSIVVAKSEAVCTIAGPPVVNPEPVEDVGGDTTECSSSFGDTCSGFQDAAGDGEPEVNSGMSARADGSLSWKPPRCQWLELRMRDLSSQVSKYDRELALIKKQELQEASKANSTLSEFMQIHQGHGNSIRKRRKRKRHEENLDTPLYINKHQILSYYHDKQNKGAETDGLLIDDDCGSTAPMEQKTGKPSSAMKKQKTETLSTAAKEHGSGNSSLASKEQKTGKGFSAVKQQKTEHSAAANKQEAETASLAKKEAGD